MQTDFAVMALESCGWSDFDDGHGTQDAFAFSPKRAYTFI